MAPVRRVGDALYLWVAVKSGASCILQGNTECMPLRRIDCLQCTYAL